MGTTSGSSAAFPTALIPILSSQPADITPGDELHLENGDVSDQTSNSGAAGESTKTCVAIFFDTHPHFFLL